MTTSPSPIAPASGRPDLQALIDAKRKAEAVLYGLNLEIAQALGEHEDARHWLKMMNDAATARWAVREAGCYFDQRGAADRASLESTVGALRG